MAKPTVPTNRKRKPQRRRVSDRVKAAIDLMVWKGRKLVDAAQTAGLDESSLRKALKRPEPLAYLNGEYEALKTSARSRTLFRAEDLADRAKSEHVRLQANSWIAGVDGVAPVVRGEIRHQHSGVVAGLVVVRAAEPAPVLALDGHLIEQQPRRRINMIGRSVPHPTQIKDLPPGAIELDGAAAMEGLRQSPAWAARVKRRTRDAE